MLTALSLLSRQLTISEAKTDARVGVGTGIEAVERGETIGRDVVVAAQVEGTLCFIWIPIAQMSLAQNISRKRIHAKCLKNEYCSCGNV